MLLGEGGGREAGGEAVVRPRLAKKASMMKAFMMVMGFRMLGARQQESGSMSSIAVC